MININANCYAFTMDQYIDDENLSLIRPRNERLNLAAVCSKCGARSETIAMGLHMKGWAQASSLRTLLPALRGADDSPRGMGATGIGMAPFKHRML